VNPTSVPAGPNQIWPSLGKNGAVWGVTERALPLAPGQTMALTIGDAYYRASLSSLPASLATGTHLYAQVDSANANTSYGAVLETHEQAGGAYNNVAGASVPAPITIGGATPTAAQAGGSAGLPKR
jgi:hypothetical protein